MKQEYIISPELEPVNGDTTLALRIGANQLGFCLKNRNSGLLYLLAWFTGEPVTVTVLEDLLIRFPQLRKPYGCIRIGYDYPEHVLVPVPLYQDETSRGFLQKTFGTGSHDMMFTDNIFSWQINNCYAVPKDIHQWTSANFRGVEYHHQFSVSVSKLRLAEAEGTMVVDFRPEELSVVLARGKDLVLTQVYAYSSPPDVIYYLLKALSVAGLSPEQTLVAVSGLIEQESSLYRELHQYFRNLEFRTYAWDEQMDQYPPHYFSSLNDLAECES